MIDTILETLVSNQTEDLEFLFFVSTFVDNNFPAQSDSLPEAQTTTRPAAQTTPRPAGVTTTTGYDYPVPEVTLPIRLVTRPNKALVTLQQKKLSR